MRHADTCFLTPVYIFVGGAEFLGTSIALNAVSVHGTCTAAFVIITAVVTAVFASVQTLSRISWLAWVGITSLFVASEYWMTLTAAGR